MYKPMDCLVAVKQKLKDLPNYKNQSMWLCCKVLNTDTANILLNNRSVSSEAYALLMEKCELLISGYPLQYILGTTQFMGLDFATRENVLIPRNDTEPMTELAIKHIGSKAISVLDLCCGSGCIGLSIKHYCPNANVTLADISDHAIKLTQENADQLNLKVNIIKTDMFTNIEGRFDVIVSNPPYIPSGVIPTLSPQVRHEPLLALDGSKDGLRFYRIINEHYRRFLKNDGLLLLEIGHDQKADILNIFKDGIIIKDLQNNDRILMLEKKDV